MVMPKGAAAFADWRSRRIVIPAVVDDEKLAIALHEIGHVLQGECPNCEPHRRDPKVREW
jgi:hypothetical protein